jgi:hypothetical protein
VPRTSWSRHLAQGLQSTRALPLDKEPAAVLEMGQAGPPSDPNAPAARVDGWPRTPMTTPPMPFTEWPYGGTTSIGVTRTGSIDSPLMTAIANTGLGRG